MDARDGVQMEAADIQWVIFMPLETSVLMCGVETFVEPKAAVSLYPMSSTRRMRMLGGDDGDDEVRWRRRRRRR